ncbi:MAG TPA: hypothetical protein VNW04_23050, partial [Puia sp.]|nr:hypothetical protein [Puia sp.]
VEKELEALIRDHCKEVIPEVYLHHIGLFRRFRQWLAYEIVRGLFFIFTFYWRQEKETRPR